MMEELLWKPTVILKSTILISPKLSRSRRKSSEE